MPKLSEGTIGIYVYIPTSLKRRLMDYIRRRYPDQLRGPLSEVVREAIEQYLNSVEEHVTHTQIVENDIRISRNNGDRFVSKSMRTAQAIAQRILEEYTEEITEPIVEQYIMEVAGGHPQTIKKYKSILKAYGFLKPLRMMYNSDKMIFKVNPNADLLR